MFYRSTDVVKPCYVSKRIRILDVKPSDNTLIRINQEVYDLLDVDISTNVLVCRLKRKYNTYGNIGDLFLMHFGSECVFIVDLQLNDIKCYNISLTNIDDDYTISVDRPTGGVIKNKPLVVGDYIDGCIIKYIANDYILVEEEQFNKPIIIDKSSDKLVFISDDDLHKYEIGD